MKHTSIKDKVLESISEEQVTPKKRWHFVLREYGIWIIGIGAFVLGAVATAVTIYVMQAGDWDIHEELGYSSFGFALQALPFVWLLLFLLFIIILDTAFRKSKKGYKVPVSIVVLGSLAVVAVTGVALHAVGVGERTDAYLEKKIPRYGTFGQPHMALWEDTETGRLAGVVTDVSSTTYFTLVDRGGKTWFVTVEVEVPRGANIVSVDRRLKLLGRVASDGQFHATHVFPFRRPDGVKKRPGIHPMKPMHKRGEIKQ